MDVIVERGRYRDTEIVNQRFKLIQGFRPLATGGYITVESDGSIGGAKSARILVEAPHLFSKVKTAMKMQKPMTDVIEFKPEVPVETVATETDEAAMDRIATRFSILDEMSKACIAGDIRAMIVSGPPGIGKSFGVETNLENASVFDRLAGKKIRYEIIKGAMTALGLYATLYKYSSRGNVLVFDDCDSILLDDLALNILKAALDSGARRRICWNSDSSMLRREGVPDSFEFKGSAIFITNIKFENVRSKKLQDHLEALQSRCHYIDLTVDSERDKLLRIRQVHRDTADNGGLFADYEFTSNEDEQVLEFMENNSKALREVSLRMAIKIADLIKVSPNNWRELAKSTCMKRGV